MKAEILPIRKKGAGPGQAGAPQPEAQVGQIPEASSPEMPPEFGPGQQAPSPEKQKASIHIMLNAEMLDNVKELADYAAEIGLIHNDPRGNVTDFINWCIEVGKERLRQYALKRREFI